MDLKHFSVLVTCFLMITDVLAFNFFASRNDQDQRRTPQQQQRQPQSEEYPAAEISRLIRQNLDFYRQAFNADELPEEIGTRNNAPNELELCETTITLETPTTLKRDSDNRVMTIAQDFSKNALQQIRHVHCKTKGSCNFDGFPVGYESDCRQEYTVRKLYVYDKDKQNLSTEKFSTPSCCTCRLRKIDL